MGTVEDDISAMFESCHGSVSLAGVMAPMLTSPDIFASFATHHQGSGGGLARASSMSQAALAHHSPHASSFSAAYDTFMPTFTAPQAPTTSAAAAGGLHRYHSAPSAFLQTLAEDAFTSIPPMGSNNTPPPPLFSEPGGLMPITELDVERSGSGNSMMEFEQFLSPDSDFSRRAAMSAQTKPENSGVYTSCTLSHQL